MTPTKSLWRPLLLVLAIALVIPAWGADTGDADTTLSTGPEVRVRSQVPPYYPATASLTGADAVVVIAAQVGANGKITDLEVVDCDRPEFGFEEAAVDAVRHWKFKPATRDGEAVATETFVTLYIGPPDHGSFNGASFTRSSIGAIRPAALPPLPGTGGGNSRGTTTSGGELDQGIYRAERANCAPGERCIYDRSQLNRRNRLAPLPRPTTPRRPSAAAAGR